jgi:6-pyruvoyltetrahydropterin/6-carboxytetrahydropterin synthase
VIITRVYKTTFEASHFIEGHPECGKVHGHSYNVTVKVTGISSKWLDFKTVKQDTEEIIKKYDHEPLGNITAEQICYQIACHLRDKGYAGQVELWETAKFGVIVGIASTMEKEEVIIAQYQ